MKTSTHLIKQTALLLVMFFTAVTAFGDSPWKYKEWTAGWCKYGDRNSVSFSNLNGGFPQNCNITENFYDGGVQFIVKGHSQKESKMTIMSLWSHTENVPSYTRRVLTWDYHMTSHVNYGHVQTFALYASKNDAIKYTGVDCSEKYSDKSGSDYLLSKTREIGKDNVGEDHSKTFTFDNSSSSTASRKEWYLMLAYTIFNGNKAADFDQYVSLSTKSSSWKDYYYKYITFDPNGGSSPNGSITNQTIENSDKLKACTMTRDGSCFIGWNTKADGSGTFYSDQATITANSTDKGPVTLYAQWSSPATNLNGEYNQSDNQVKLTWNAGSIPANFNKYNWVIYRDGTQIGTCESGTYAFLDSSMNTETTHTYDVYFMSDDWNGDINRDGIKASVVVNCTRKVPVNNLKVEQKDDRLCFTWESNYTFPDQFGKYCIYVDNEKTPIYTIEPTATQKVFKWEHRHVDGHDNRQHGVDSDGVHYTEEGLSVCSPHNYRIEGVIGNLVVNKDSVLQRAIGQGTQFYDFDASKGVYEGSVKLTWHVNNQGSATKTYTINRREAGRDDADWEELTQFSSADEYLSYTDDKALPGVFYFYKIIGMDKCEDGMIVTNDIGEIGFAKSTGTVTGRIAYGASGVAVKGVDVVMTKTDSGGLESNQFHAMSFNTNEGFVKWAYPSADYAANQFASGDFSVQLWLYPDALSDGKIIDFGNGVGLNMTASGGLTFSDGNGKTQTFSDVTLNKDIYYHMSLTRSGTQMRCYVLNLNEKNEPVVQKGSITLTGDLLLSPATQFTLGHFKGSADEFRLWTKCLSEDNILENFNHLLVGNEEGLETYWTFDENLSTQFFDYSRTGTDYHKHHGSVENATPSSRTPAALALRAKTDADGNYVIQGVPFSVSGTTYTVTPLFGIHEFNPNKSVLFVGQNSLVHNKTDFEDVSSFPMEGYVYYAGTNIPAEGIMLYVDGDLVTGNGEVKKTDAVGYYKISVPIGKHYVEAKLDGHTMVAGGRFPTSGTFNFDRAVTYDFADSTLVNFVGRVGGGERNDTLAVGFGASKNNIGIATVKLELNNESLSFNCADDHISAATANRSLNNDTTTVSSINSTAWTGIGADSKYIYIRTDSLTGEFSALLPPLKYFVKSISIDTNPDIEFSSLPEIDLTNPLKELSDTLETGGNAYKYNTKQVWTYYAQPQLDVTETGYNKPGVFGIKEKTYGNDNDGNKYTVVDIWKVQEDGSVSYLLDYPIYETGDMRYYDFYAYERYTNRDGEQEVEDIIPLNGQTLKITNEMSSEQKVVYRVDDPGSGYKVGDVVDVQDIEMELNSDGCGQLSWQVGYPNITSPYTRHFSVSMERNNRTYVLCNMDAIVLGALTNGDNFVTKGPDVVQFVLRDPPGAKSRTTLKKGQVVSKTHYYTERGYGDFSLVGNIIYGSDLKTGEGIGLMLMTGNKVEYQIDTGVHTQWEHQHNVDTTTTVTTVESVSTSAAYPYVGSAGDVYVGTSYNMIVGSCRNLLIRKDLQTQQYVIALEDALSLGNEIATSFKYSQYEIETVMIPKWEDQRNSFLTQVASESVANNYENTGKKPLYLSWIEKGKDGYGEEGNYRFVAPENPEETFIDSVQWCNNQIKQWRGCISENEEDKVNAIRKGNAENFSIDGGSSYTYSKRDAVTKNNSRTDTWKMGLVSGGHFGAVINAAAEFGVITNLSIEIGGGYIKGDGTKTETFTEWEYHVEDGNRDTDLSINKYGSDTNGYSDFFYLYGGQTYNPFEDKEVTKYYNPGTPLGNGTEQMEQPNMSISITGQNPSKNVTVTDIPSGQEANLTLHCTNMARAHQGTNFSYNLIVPETANTKGLQILMDGVPISGRSIMLPQGETVTKQITIRQTDQSILDYEGIRLRFCSQYQPGKIYDDVTINAHFKPSSSPVELAITEPVLNTESKNGELSMKVTNFDRQFKNLRKVGVQYRFQGNTQWIDLQTWVTNEADTIGTNFILLPSSGDLRLAVDMSDDSSYPEGRYEFRAFTSTPYDTEQVSMYSDVITVIKDMTRPRNLFTPSPANGILGYGDQLSIEFNEDIVPGYVSDKNVIVTAKLNQQTVNHEVALHLQASGDAPKTENPVFLSGDFALDFWFNWHDSGTLLRSGTDGKKFALGIDNGGHFVITVASNQYTSTDVLPKDEWIFLALNFKADLLTFDVLAQYGDKNVRLFNNMPVTTDGMQTFSTATDNYLYLGNINADMHALSLYDISHDVKDASSTMYQSKDGYVYGLVNYWPMDEGHGNVAADLRHTHDFVVPNSWKLENVNYALQLNDTKGAKANISKHNTTRGDSYAIEMWYKRGVVPDSVTLKKQVVFQMDKMQLYYDSLQSLVLEYNGKEQMVASHDDFPEDSVWRHLALNVIRGQAASFYLDGQRTAVIAEADVPTIQGAELIIGKNAIGAEVDEVRIWHAALSESRLTGNIYNTIDTADVYSRGLVTYYPFEQAGTVNNVKTKVPTMQNMAKGYHNLQLSALNSQLVRAVPPVKNAPEETKLIASPVASERKVVINLTGANCSPRSIEGTTLNITVDQVHDLHGNTSLPIRWTAYVKQNTLTWTKDSVNIYKMYGDDYTFDIDIENKSGNVEYYTLYNMPQWLSIVDSERTDNVQPLRKKTLRFMVNPLVNIGNYDVTIGLQGNNEILEPLRIVMKVRGKMPDWAVDPMQYENQMTITGQVRIGGVLVENPDSRVAAFIDNVCRGVAAPKQIRGTAYVPLSIYGTALQEINGNQENLDQEKPVTFRIWDAGTGVTYTNVSLLLPGSTTLKDTLYFDPTKSYGTFDNPVIFTKSKYVEQPLNLKQGWNWLSLGVEPANDSVSVVFKDVRSWNGRLKLQKDSICYFNGIYWSGNLKKVHANKMYKMFLSRLDGSRELPQPLIVIGEQVDLSKAAVTLHEGWNWIPYTPTATMPLDEALAGANPQTGDQVKSQFGFAFYGPYGWEGNLEALESGKGYLYKSNYNQEKTFVYPALTNTQQRARGIHRARRAPAVFVPVDPTRYPDNMSMVIKLVNQGEPVDNAEVAAYINNECRGAATCDEGLYYLLIAGEGSGQPIELRIAYGDGIQNLDPSLTFSSDGNVGTPWNPLVIDLQNIHTGINGIMAGDDDEESWYSLQGIKLQRKPTRRGVYLRGQTKTTVTQ